VTDPRATAPQAPIRATTGVDALRIWEGVPLRNPAFTGREMLLLTLQRALDRRAKASVLPHALHGLGGVGKTQLAVEFAYRYADRYDVVWWIPAEHQTLVLQSLRDLGRRLGTPETANLQQSASLVLDKLAGSPLHWLLIYDNANDPDDIANLIPSGGGHVILTSRNQTWSGVWDPIEVDVFDRPESVALVLKRSPELSTDDAERLADRLGDLPLALDQAASARAATGMSVSAYLAELDRYRGDLAPDESASSRTTIAALMRLALQRLRADAPAAAELLEMFASLGAEPISGGLLRRGRDARVSAALGAALRDQIALDRAIRLLGRYGLAKVDADRRVQVHRLFQLVLRDQLDDEAARRSRANVHRVLASANPGYPWVEENWPVHAEMGPHIRPAGLVESDLPDACRVVLDQSVYLRLIGDLEGARRLGEIATDAWSKVDDRPDLGPDGELTLLGSIHLATSLRHLGFNEGARALGQSIFERLQDNPVFGPDHEHTLLAAGEVAVSLRVAGLFRSALERDRDTVARTRRIFGEEDQSTLNAQGNLAVNLRMLSEFQDAVEMDAAVVAAWQQNVSENDNRLLFAQTNLARDLYGLGRYAEALELQQRILPPFREQLGSQHPRVLLAGRTLAVTLRKVGRYADALAAAAEHHHAMTARYGPEHEHSLAAAMTLANSHRVTGDLEPARDLATEAVERYLRVFGDDHPLALAATANYAIVLGALGELDAARETNERIHSRMAETLGAEHGYTLCAASNLANDLARAGESAGARRLSEAVLAASREYRGEQHPYTLVCAVNAALDRRAVDDETVGQALLDQAVRGLAEALGGDHPETLAARAGRRIDCDIEPPPT
jgi:tetratricopeptide (TPR) repeat protein